LIRAFFGEDVVEITFNRDTGETVGEQVKFSPRGKFLRIWEGRKPRFTRIGAVVRLREHLAERRSDADEFRVWIEPRWVVLHNPFCPNPIPPNIWGDCPQFLADGDVMRWSDGAAVFG
jgi:hypothetical protein